MRFGRLPRNGCRIDFRRAATALPELEQHVAHAVTGKVAALYTKCGREPSASGWLLSLLPGVSPDDNSAIRELRHDTFDPIGGHGSCQVCQYGGMEARADGVERGSPYAVVGRDATDVDFGDVTGLKPASEVLSIGGLTLEA